MASMKKVSFRFLRELSKAFRGFMAIQFVGRNSKSQFLPFRSIRRKLKSVQAQEHKARAEGRALVPVDERMITTKVKQVSARDFHNINVRRLAAETRLRCGHSRFKQRQVAQTFGAAEPRNRLGMDFLHDLHSQVETVARRVAHASFFIVRA